MTKNSNTGTEAHAQDISRRSVLASAAGIAAAGAGGYLVGTGTTAAETAGNTVATRTNPAAAIYADRLQLVAASPTDPSNGDVWYDP